MTDSTFSGEMDECCRDDDDRENPMTEPMSEERLKTIRLWHRSLWIHDTQPGADYVGELLGALDHYTTLPPEVAAAMERYANRDRLLRLESYYEHEADLDAIAQHFTSLFKKVS